MFCSTAKQLQFESKRKQHYNEAMFMKRAKQLIADEFDDEDDDEREGGEVTSEEVQEDQEQWDASDADEWLDGSLSDRTLQKNLPYFRLRDIYYFSSSTVHVERRTGLFGIKEGPNRRRPSKVGLKCPGSDVGCLIEQGHKLCAWSAAQIIP